MKRHRSLHVIARSTALAVSLGLALSACGGGISDESEDSDEVKIGTDFTDDETGDVITVVSAVRSNPTSYFNPDGEMVYLEVQVVPGRDYGGTISSSDFYLDSGDEERNFDASAQDGLESDGYDYFDSAPRREGEHTGYIPIYIPETADALTGAYIRPEAKVPGEDKKIPEFRSEFEVPAS